MKVNKIISSDLKRARQTTEIINSKLNVPIEYTEKLREMNNGEIARMLNSLAEKKYPGLYYNTLKLNERYPGEKKSYKFYNRIVRDFEKIIKENEYVKNLMIVTYSGVINIIYRYINNMEWSNKIKSIKIENASIIDNDKRFVDLENFVNRT